MGVCYMLLRDDRGESFELNKGNWHALFPGSDKPFTLNSENLSREAIVARIANGVFRWGDDGMDSAKMIADRLIEWCEAAPIRIINDTGWDEEWYTYKATADRFSPSSIPGYKDYKELP